VLTDVLVVFKLPILASITFKELTVALAAFKEFTSISVEFKYEVTIDGIVRYMLFVVILRKETLVLYASIKYILYSLSNAIP
jgi:hypothetical protein